MARAMFEYTKTILKKVSFSGELFTHELHKAVARLLPYEIDELRLWLIDFTKQKPELVPCLMAIAE
jgi:DNA replication protein DnaD